MNLCCVGAIDLPLKCARDWDVNNLGQGYHEDGEREGDSRKPYFDRRMDGYACVFETLSAFDQMLDAEVAGRSTPNGQRLASSTPKLDVLKCLCADFGETIDAVRTNAYNQALSSDDALFHHSFYDWLLERRMNDQLLLVRLLPVSFSL